MVLGAGLVLVERHELVGFGRGVHLAGDGRKAIAGRVKVEVVDVQVAVVALRAGPFLVRIDGVGRDHQAFAGGADSELHVGRRTLDDSVRERKLDVLVVAAGVVSGAVVRPGLVTGEVVAVLVQRAAAYGRCEIRIALAGVGSGMSHGRQGGKGSGQSGSGENRTGHGGLTL